MEILVVQTAFLGDLLLSLPLIRGIYRCFPEARVSLVCRQGLGSIFSELQLVDEVLEVKKGDKASYRGLKAQLNKKSWDIIFCPHESFRSAQLVRALKANKKVGFKKWWNAVVFDERVDRDWSQPDALRQLRLLNPICGSQAGFYKEFADLPEALNPKIQDKWVDFRSWKLPEWASMKVDFSSMAPLEEFDQRDVFLFPGSVWETKRWTESGFQKLAQKFSQSGYRVNWMGSPQEADLCEKLASQVPGSRSFAGKLSLVQTLKALSQGKILVSNDSGSMHMGALAGLPTVAIFGPTTLDLGYRPWQQQAIVVQKKLDCRPCGKHGHKECPLGHHKCMKSISAEEVFQASQTLNS